jgi:SOS response regulatory protein OraA/RecX
MKDKNENFLNIDVSSLSHESLVEIIKQLKDSGHVTVRKKAQKELVRRLKEKGFSNKRIAMILTNNVYGKRTRLAIAKEWADALEISKEEFLGLIGE